MLRLRSFSLRLATLVPLHAAQEALQFNRDVRPILSDKCFACHGRTRSIAIPGGGWTRRMARITRRMG